MIHDLNWRFSEAEVNRRKINLHLNPRNNFLLNEETLMKMLRCHILIDFKIIRLVVCTPQAATCHNHKYYYSLVAQLLNNYRKGGDNWLFITVVPKTYFLFDFYQILIGWFMKLSVQTFRPLIVSTEGIILCITISTQSFEAIE